jgi:hypothetical protein
VSQQFAINHYQQTASARQQIDQNAASKEAAVSDRVELSVNSQYTANRIFEEIAARVAEKFGVDAAAQIQFNPNLDTSSEATAERIFTFATGFYQNYREQNAGEDEEETLTRFTSIVRDAIDRGFDEARGILTGLSGFTPGIEDTINETYQRLQELLSGFEEEQLTVLGSVDEESQDDLTGKLLFPPPEIPADPEEPVGLSEDTSETVSDTV